MTFGEAIEQAKNGFRVQRAGWNGQNMWVCYLPPITIPEGMVNGRTKLFVPHGDLAVCGYFALWTAQRTWQPGWVASQADMLANDWTVVS